ncbi:MAG: 2Fe-2S iron-sulfur cluster-binding protein [Rubripirellula sp.]
MPTIDFAGLEIECQHQDNLRKVLLAAKAPLYTKISRPIHCRGLGTCGTCAVAIDGAVSEPTAIEKWRLNFPPHKAGSNLRLACQCRVLGDVHVVKHPGLWGNQRPIANADSRT